MKQLGARYSKGLSGIMLSFRENGEFSSITPIGRQYTIKGLAIYKGYVLNQ